MHPLLIASGLGNKFKISTETTNSYLASFLGKRVVYKSDLLTSDFIKQHGTICVENIFEIREVQVDFKGEESLRGYAPYDDFGRVIYPPEIEIYQGTQINH